LASPKEVQHIKTEADYLSDVLSKTDGLLAEADTDRLIKLTAELNRLAERAKKSN
jgi:hypothetical protein